MNPSALLKTKSRQNTCRQVSKPLMERRRRARINSYLGDLRTLLLQLHKGKSCCRSKMEKADILELAVQHLKALTQASDPTNQESSMGSFCTGYMDCVREVSHFLNACNEIQGTVRKALLCWLSDRAAALARISGPGQHQQLQYWDLLVHGVPACPGAAVPVLAASFQPSPSSDFCKQPSFLPVANSAFWFLQQSGNLTLLKPDEIRQAPPKVHTWAHNEAPEKKTHDHCDSSPVWRPWGHNL
ncbi:transcription factor HES-4-B-like [Arapaima gigas]